MGVGTLLLGIDIGGTTTTFGLVTPEGEILARGEIPTLPDRPADDLVERICSGVTKLCAGHPDKVPAGVGVGAPNANHHRGTVENPPNLAWGGSVDLAALFRQRFPGRPVVVTNDANAAALGEQCYGGGRGMRDLIVITLGTGVGSGIIANGELLVGASGFAGELGHTTVDPGGRHCACGKRGCLETYVSAPGLCRTVLSLLADRRDETPLRRIPPARLTAHDVYLAARDGDPVARAAFAETGRILGMKLADAVAHTSPEAIFLTGGLAAAGDLLLLPARRSLEEFLFPVYRKSVRLLLSEIPAGDGAILGAAALVLSRTGR